MLNEHNRHCGCTRYECTPVCAKPSYWMYLEGVNSSMNSCGNGWIDLFWTSFIYGWGMMCGFQRFLEACILHDVFDNYGWRLRMLLCRTTFAEKWFLELRNLMWRWWSWIFHLHGNLKCLLLSSHVHARQQTPNLFQLSFILTTTLWTRSLWDCFSFCCMWATDFTLEFDAPARCMSTRMRETKQHGTAADK